MAPGRNALRQNKSAVNIPARTLDQVQDQPAFKATKKQPRTKKSPHTFHDNIENEGFESRSSPTSSHVDTVTVPVSQLTEILTELCSLRKTVDKLQAALPKAEDHEEMTTNISNIEYETEEIKEQVSLIEADGAKESTLQDIEGTVTMINDYGAQETSVDALSAKMDVLDARVQRNDRWLDAIATVLERIEETLDEHAAVKVYYKCSLYDNEGVRLGRIEDGHR